MDYEQERIQLVNICQSVINIFNNTQEMMGKTERMILQSKPRYIRENRLYPGVVEIYYNCQRLSFYIEDKIYDVILNTEDFKTIVDAFRKEYDIDDLSRIITQYIIQLASNSVL